MAISDEMRQADRGLSNCKVWLKQAAKSAIPPAMKHRSRPAEQDDLLRPRLIDMIDGRHELVRLAALIDWSWFEREWAGFFLADEGRPATHPRLVAGLLYLQHTYGLSDEAVLARWVENPYFQHFTGETFFQHRLPIHPSSLSRWRGRIGEEGVEWLLTKTIEAGRAAGAVTPRSLAEIAVDTTVMEKAIAHPTDSRLYERARRSLVTLAQKAGIALRQNYNRLAPRLAAQAGRHAHARQFRRMRKALRTLKGYTGRGHCQLVGLPGVHHCAAARPEPHAAIWTQISCRQIRNALSRVRRYCPAVIR